jgi:hypothetical protein
MISTLSGSSGGAGKMPEISDVHVVAVFEPGTGKVVHVHSVTVFKGGRSVSEGETIQAALARAAEAGHNTETLKTKLSKNPVHGQLSHKIDTKTGEFVPLTVDRARLKLR